MRALLFLLHASVTTLKMAGCNRIVTFKCLWRNYGDITVCFCKTRKRKKVDAIVTHWMYDATVAR